MLARVRRLIDTAAALRKGETFSITRLTSLKALCAERDDALAFLQCLAEAADARMRSEKRSEFLSKPVWETHLQLATIGLKALDRSLVGRSSTSSLSDAIALLVAAQNTRREVPYGVVREILNRDLLVIEDALRGAAAPETAGHWAYQAARDFTERYDPRHGSGLIPASAPSLEFILEFWSQRLFVCAARELPVRVARAPRAKTEPAASPDSYSPPAHPALDFWVQHTGWIEIGRDDFSTSLVRILDRGGMIWEGARSYDTFKAALDAADQALSLWLDNNEPSWRSPTSPTAKPRRRR